MNYLIVILFLIHYVAALRTGGWKYPTLNPTVWPILDSDKFSECQLDDHQKQGLINILPEYVKCDQERLRPLELYGYDTSYVFNFSNTQLTIRGALQEGTPSLEFKGSGLPAKLSPFELIQFHFHWRKEGLEHVVDGEQAALELHLVHVSEVDPKYYAVIAILFEIVNETNLHFNSISSVARQLAQQPSSFFNTNVNLIKLFPANKNRYYYYDVNVTPQPCTERVLWTIMADKVGITEEQLSFIEANAVARNFNESKTAPAVASLNRRPVYTMDCDLANYNNGSNGRSLVNTMFSVFLIISLHVLKQ